MNGCAAYRSCCLLLAAASAAVAPAGCGEVDSADAARAAASPQDSARTREPVEDVSSWIDDSLRDVERATAMAESAAAARRYPSPVMRPAPPAPPAAAETPEIRAFPAFPAPDPATLAPPAPRVAPPPPAPAGHVMDLTGVTIPDTPVSGRIGARPFVLTRVEYFATTGALTFEGVDHQTVFLFPFFEDGLAGRAVRIDRPSHDFNQPHVHLHCLLADGTPDIAMYTDGYVLWLSFGEARDGMIPGRLYLCVPDDDGSWMAGSFQVAAPAED